jgi:hypothetical protein
MAEGVQTHAAVREIVSFLRIEAEKGGKAAGKARA